MLTGDRFLPAGTAREVYPIDVQCGSPFRLKSLFGARSVPVRTPERKGAEWQAATSPSVPVEGCAKATGESVARASNAAQPNLATRLAEPTFIARR